MKSVKRFLFSGLLASQIISISTGASASENMSSYDLPKEVQASNKTAVEQGNLLVGVVLGGATVGMNQFRAGSEKQILMRTEGSHAVLFDRNRVLQSFDAVSALTDTTLRGTVHGDVVQLEYTISGNGLAAETLSELEASKSAWERRFADLSAEHADLVRRVEDQHSHFAAIPDSDSTQGARMSQAERLRELQRDAKINQRRLVDAEKRMHVAREQYQVLLKTLASAQNTGSQVLGQHIRRDLLIGPTTRTELGQFFLKHVNQKLKSGLPVSGIRLARVLTPNASLVSRATTSMRVGAASAGIIAIFAVEELVFGKLSDALMAKTANVFSPERRTEPKP